jgi:hypothetical protein
MNKLLVAIMAGALAGPLATSTPASAQSSSPGAKIGVLTCWILPGTQVKLLIHSSAALNCVFEGAGGKESYKGESGVGLGLDLKWDNTKTIAYTVLAATSDYKPGGYVLAGRYVGATASAAVGAGAGASMLVGGGAQNFSLQPLAVETGTGLGAAAGVGYLFLEPNPTADKK